MEKSQDALVLLRQIIRATDLHDKHLSRMTGLTMPQLMTMQTLRINGPLTIGMLAKEMNLEFVPEKYFFTQRRWDSLQRIIKQEKEKNVFR